MLNLKHLALDYRLGHSHLSEVLAETQSDIRHSYQAEGGRAQRPRQDSRATELHHNSPDCGRVAPGHPMQGPTRELVFHVR